MSSQPERKWRTTEIEAAKLFHNQTPLLIHTEDKLLLLAEELERQAHTMNALNVCYQVTNCAKVKEQCVTASLLVMRLSQAYQQLKG